MNHKSNRPQGMSTNTTQQLFEYLDAFQKQLDRIEWKIGRSFQGIMQSVDNIGEEIMSQLTDALDQAEAAAASNSAADDAAEALLVTIAQMLKDALAAGGDQTAVIARVSALASGISSRATQLGAAVAANTPAAPAPV